MQLKKLSFTWLVMLLLSTVFQASAFAADVNPITKIKSKMTFNWDLLNGLDFMFYLIMIPISLSIIFLIVYSVYGIIVHLIRVRRGKESLSDKKFWIEIGVTIFIVFIFLSGLFWDFLELVYNWTSQQDLTSTTPSSTTN
ncbi:hypothetical protein DFQ01_11095 [Paenibacillus cellulosilyticus]|uniref:Uncharacterized protein n=1 Tax=Paenibacillus cellulosilyticus TaxID=375489 RepID=A0A2V2Z1F9_9BACL|nr:hypothetical protein [Paenibacillus cellulosilyticus]PWW01205.1 hypothetical protein DFQ01_11095 [Paenibacillus cellulosilyticus]QKS46840.1 hypothetical protein HUB94_20365 [Paenibacillus cellulosilyticus]